MRAKPGWLFFALWLVAYLLLDIAFGIIVHKRFWFAELPDALKDSALAAGVTWLIALYRWYRAGSAL